MSNWPREAAVFPRIRHLAGLAGFGLACSSSTLALAEASVPGWWIESGYRVERPAEDFAAANCGQVKWFVAAAVQAIDHATGFGETRLGPERVRLLKLIDQASQDDFLIAELGWVVDIRLQVDAFAIEAGVLLAGEGSQSVTLVQSDRHRPILLGQLKHAFDWTPMRPFRTQPPLTRGIAERELEGEVEEVQPQ